MNTFAQTLQKFREEDKLTRKDLAERIDKSPQFVAALENPKTEKAPSFETLRDLVYVLAGDPTEHYASVNLTRARDLLFSAIGIPYELNVPYGLEQEVTEQVEAAAGGTEFWIISDTLGEAQEARFAKAVAENIVHVKARYLYFIPLLSDPRISENVLINLRAHKGMTEDILAERVAIFEVSRCAFPCRLRITDPNGMNPQGRYNLGARGASEQQFYQMPTELLVQAIQVYSDLLQMVLTREALATAGEARVEGKKAADKNELIGTRETGYIRRVFPKSNARKQRGR